MEEAQSLNYNSFENDLDFDVMLFDGQSLHADASDYSKTLEDEMNNTCGTENAKTSLSTWLNDITSVGSDKRFGHIDDETVIVASEGFPGKTDSENLANGLSTSYLNDWFDYPLELVENRTGFNGNHAADTKNGQLIGDDFVLSKHLDLVREDKLIPKKRKTTETSTKSDEIDGFVGAFDEIDQNVLKMREDRLVETPDFEMKKPKHSGLVSNGGRENIECIQPDPKRKRTKLSDTVNAGEFATTNLASSKRMTQLASVAGRSRNRNAKTRNRRGKTGFSSMFEDLSPAPSPEAEVPSLSPNNTNKYIEDYELITLDTKDLNRRVKCLPKSIVQEIKHRRRTLKNRGYARSCREKKISETSTLQQSNGDLEKELANLKLELHLMMLQCNDWKRKYEELTSVFKKRGLRVEV